MEESYAEETLRLKTIPQLKEICKQFKLKVSGTKSQLIERILKRDDIMREKEELKQKKEQEKLNKIHQKNIEKARKAEEKKAKRDEDKKRKKEEKERSREEDRQKKREEYERHSRDWWKRFEERWSGQENGGGGAGSSYSGSYSSGGRSSAFAPSGVLLDAFRFMELDSNTIQAGDVNKAFKKLSLKYHPDKGGSTEQQQKLTQSRELLKSYGYT